MSRIGIAGFLHESNTFLATPTTYEHFERASLTKGVAVRSRWEGSHHELGGFFDGAAEFGFEPVPLMATYAVPSGTITAGAFDRILRELVIELEAALPLDGVLLALHGATVSENYPDADGEVLRRFRQLLGQDVPLIVTLDLHANISRAMAENCDAIVAYRSNPHLDQRQRGREAAGLMARTLRGEIRPVQALETPPLIINISRQYTSEAPARSLYEDVECVASWDGIVSASAAMGFYYADVAEMGASFLAVADRDVALARRAARWMAERAWMRRAEFGGSLPGPEEAVRRAAQSRTPPVVLMEIGDNVGGGSPADSTILFAEILRQQLSDTLVVLYDPDAVEKCVAAGVRQTVELEVGAKTDAMHGQPVSIKGQVRMIADGVFEETKVRHGGWGRSDQGTTVVLTSLRMAPMSLEQILSLGIKPERKKILIVKGVVAPRAAYEPIAGEIVLVDTPGATCDNPASFRYLRRRHPLYPLEKDAVYSAE
jgi:microcystin degradation protein MlrC